jgi:hypothetical protein
MSFAGKFGIFVRPDSYDRRHRLDLEAQADYFTGYFDFQNNTISDSGAVIYNVDKWEMSGIGVVGRLRWSVELEGRWQPYVHLGYTVNMLTLGDGSAISYGPNVGAGMRIRLCPKYAFYFEYETGAMGSVDFPLSDVDANLASALATNESANIMLHPSYSMVSVGFEFPITFCLTCPDKGNSSYPNGDDRR